MCDGDSYYHPHRKIIILLLWANMWRLRDKPLSVWDLLNGWRMDPFDLIWTFPKMVVMISLFSLLLCNRHHSFTAPLMWLRTLKSCSWKIYLLFQYTECPCRYLITHQLSGSFQPLFFKTDRNLLTVTSADDELQT